MNQELLRNLDQIERRPDSMETYSEALDLFRRLARSPSDYVALAERYAGSLSRQLVLALAIHFAGIGPFGTLQTLQAVAVLTERLRLSSDTVILQNCRRALSLHLGPCSLLETPLRLPPTLFPFLRYRLAYDQLLEQDHLLLWALNLVMSVCGSYLVHTFIPAQSTWLLDRLYHLSPPPSAQLDDRVAEVAKQWQHGALLVRCPLLDRLDAMERQASTPSQAEPEEALEPRQRFAVNADDLWLLVERYGESAQPRLLRALCSLVEQRTESKAAVDPEVVYGLLEKLRASSDPKALLAALATIRRQLAAGLVWETPPEAPPSLYPFLTHCLHVAARQPLVNSGPIQRATIQVANALDLLGLLTPDSGPAAYTALLDWLLSLTDLTDDAPADERLWLKTFLLRSERAGERPLFARLSQIELDWLQQSEKNFVPPGQEAAEASRWQTIVKSRALMQSFVQDEIDLHMLIEQYGPSLAEPLVFALAELVGEKGKSLAIDLLPLLFALVERVCCTPSSGVIDRCLRPLRRLIETKSVETFPASLYPLLVQYIDQLWEVTAVLVALHETGQLENALTPSQSKTLGRRIVDMAAPAKERLAFSEEDASKRMRLRWHFLLRAWHEGLHTRHALEGLLLPAEVKSMQVIGRPPASEAELTPVEARLGARLPRTYRSFLLVTNGWTSGAGCPVDLWPTEAIVPFGEKHDDTAGGPSPAGRSGRQTAPTVADRQYFVYGSAQNPGSFRVEYLPKAIQVGVGEGTIVYLLNPQIVTANGEWEAWRFEKEAGTARRYRCFWDFLVAEREAS
ncbi:MAG: SMI1/KNR4 family protein [Dehalococcoidia bacterium]